MGPIILRLFVLGLILSNILRYWFVSTAFSLLFQNLPSISDFYCNIHKRFLEIYVLLSIVDHFLLLFLKSSLTCWFLQISFHWYFDSSKQIAFTSNLDEGPDRRMPLSVLVTWCQSQSAYSWEVLWAIFENWLPVLEMIHFSNFAYFTGRNHSVSQPLRLFSIVLCPFLGVTTITGYSVSPGIFNCFEVC